MNLILFATNCSIYEFSFFFNFKVTVKQGFQTRDDTAGSSVLEQYQRSGAGITLEYKAGVTADIDDIVTALLKTCPVPMMVSSHTLFALS